MVASNRVAYRDEGGLMNSWAWCAVAAAAVAGWAVADSDTQRAKNGRLAHHLRRSQQQLARRDHRHDTCEVNVHTMSDKGVKTDRFVLRPGDSIDLQFVLGPGLNVTGGNVTIEEKP